MPRSKYGEKGTVEKVRVKLKKTFSPAGKEYLKYGEKGFEELSKTRQKTARLKKRVAAIGPAPHDPKETKTQKERGGYISSSSGSGSGTVLTATEWHKKEGRSTSQSSLRSYRGYKRNFGRK
jgi:hypothetical protein